MQYTINGVNVSDYGITPCQGTGTNIALSGFLNLPPRVGETFHEWFESDGVEPYVDAEDISFGGIDIQLTGFIIGSKAGCTENIQALIANANAIGNTFTLGTPFGNFVVYLKSVQSKQTKTICEVTIVFRCPAISFPATTLPSTGSSKNTINDIPFAYLGLTLRTSPEYFLPDMRSGELTAYNTETFTPSSRGMKAIVIECIFSAVNLYALVLKAQQLRKIFSDPGLKTIKLNDHFQFTVFAVNGFEISNIRMYGSAFISDFKIQLTVNEETII